MEYVKPNKGGFKLLCDNYMYVKQKVLENGAVCWECLCQPKRFFLKPTNLPEVILVTIALSVSYALEKP